MVPGISATPFEALEGHVLPPTFEAESYVYPDSETSDTQNPMVTFPFFEPEVSKVATPDPVVVSGPADSGKSPLNSPDTDAPATGLSFSSTMVTEGPFRPSGPYLCPAGRWTGLQRAVQSLVAAGGSVEQA